MDSNDGNGAQGSGEAMGDTVAMLQLRDCCIGPNFTASNCGGYGNACTSCTGVRDQDRAKHATNEILTPANIATRCTSAGGDPCGREVHCEGSSPANTVWDLAYRDLPARPMATEDAWALVDKLWWESGPTRTAGLHLHEQDRRPPGTTAAAPRPGTRPSSRPTTTTATSPTAPRTRRRSSPPSTGTESPAASRPTRRTRTTRLPDDRQRRHADRDGRTTASRSAGARRPTRRPTGSSGTTSAAASASPRSGPRPTRGRHAELHRHDGLERHDLVLRHPADRHERRLRRLISNCVSATPSPCTTPGTPTIGTATTPASNQIRITWTAGAPAGATYNIYRVMGAPACPGSGFTLLATGVAASPYNDNTVSGGSTYSYKVTAVDGTGGCESAQSGCVSAVATGACTAPPNFAGLTTVANPGNAVCTLNLSWSAATPVCTGPATYNIYRSTTAPFTPAAGNRIATGVATTTYSDITGLVSGTTYYYIVRAVDSSNASEETNTVTKSAKVTGPITTSTLTETFEGALSGGGFDLAGWTHGFLSGTVDWVWSTAQAQTPTHSWFSADQTTTSDRVLTSPSFGIGASTTLSFYHTYAFEGSTATCYDGGTLEISTDGGTNWTVVPDAAFTAGLFTGTVNTGFANPIGGKRAWCGGTIGAMTQVTVNLGGTYSGQANSKLRWHEGDDSSANVTGWYVDSVTIANAQTAGSCTTGSGCTAPGAPTLTGATGSCGGSGVVLTWTAGTGSTASYNVYRSTNTSCPVGTLTKIAGPIATLTYTDTTAVAGTTYTYVVRGACDAGGSSESPNSNCLAGTLPAVPAAPAAPGVADIDACAASGVSITWSTVSGATGYDLQVDGGAITVGVTSPYTYVPVDANSHTYAIRGKNASCTGAFSTTTAGTDVATAPPSITGVMMWNRASDLFITWTQVANPALVDYYEVMRASAPAGPFSTSVGTTTGIVHGMTLDLTTEPANSYYKVRAVKGSCPGPLAP